MFDLPTIAIGSVAYMAYKRAGKPKSVEGEHKEIYENALEHLTDPDKLRKLADSFQKNGYKLEASMLRKRANLRALPKEIKERNKTVLEKALASTNVEAILKLADAFDNITATGAAGRLREHAKKIQNTQAFDVEKPKQKIVEETKEVIPEVKAEVVSSPAIHGDSK